MPLPLAVYIARDNNLAHSTITKCRICSCPYLFIEGSCVKGAAFLEIMTDFTRKVMHVQGSSRKIAPRTESLDT